MKSLVFQARDNYLARNNIAVERMKGRYLSWVENGRVTSEQDTRFRQYSKLLADMQEIPADVLNVVLEAMRFKDYTRRDAIILTQVLAEQPLVSEVDKCLIDFPLRYKMKDKMREFISALNKNEEQDHDFNMLTDSPFYITYERDFILYIKYKHIYQFKRDSMKFFEAKVKHAFLDFNPKELTAMVDIR